MIWITGAQGMLGSYLPPLLKEAGERFLASDAEVDITDPAQIERFAASHPIKTIINCAAFTNVPACETQYGLACKVNAEGPRSLAAFAKQKDALLIHVSTDYVFDGTAAEPYPEDAPTKPVNAYGRSKLQGEKAVLDSGARAVIVRTSWLYGRKGKNFVYTALSLLHKNGTMQVVNDQVGKTTYARDLARTLLDLRTVQPGIYHFANRGALTWFDFTKEIARLGCERKILQKTPQITPVSSDTFNDTVTRPAFSVLATEKTEKATNNTIRPWQEALRDFMDEIKDNPFPMETNK